MAQNIYDNKEFFDSYSHLRRSIEGLDGAPEWPTLRSWLPDLNGRRALDLGCGYGWFCRWAREHGATSVTGVDISEKMLERAVAATKDASITYVRGDLEDIALPPQSFDLVYSSLAFHYVKGLDRLMAQIHSSLTPGGSFVFSVEHPIYTAPTVPGWSTNAKGEKTWPVNCYLDEGQRSTDWLAKGVLKQHRTFSTYFNLLVGAGFSITHLNEWGPTPEQLASVPGVADEHHRPTFLLVAAEKSE